MQVAIEDAGTLRKQVTLTFENPEIRSREDGLIGKYAGRISVKGFRKGKIPNDVVRKRFGEAIRNEACEALLRESFDKALKEHQLRPLGPISSDSGPVLRDDGLSQIFVFDVLPEVVLPDPSSLDLPRDSSTVDDAAVDVELTGLAKRLGNHRDLAAGETLAADDVITLSGSLKSGDDLIREVHDLHHLIGGYPLFGTPPETVVGHCAGKTVGDVIEFDTTLPENFKPEDWAGKTARVSATIQKAQRLEPAAIDDELAKKLGTASADELRQRVREGLSARFEEELHSRQIEALTEQLLTRCTFEVPPQLLTDVTAERVRNAIARAKQDDPAADAEALRAEQEPTLRSESERSIRRHCILETIALANQVRTTENDLRQQIGLAAQRSGRPADDILKELQDSGRLTEVINDIRQHKALELFLERSLGQAAQV